jgi:hypothetical protein
MLHRCLTGLCLSFLTLLFSLPAGAAPALHRLSSATATNGLWPGSSYLYDLAGMRTHSNKPTDLIYFLFRTEGHGPFDIHLYNHDGVHSYHFNTSNANGIYIEPGTYNLYMSSTSSAWPYFYVGCEAPTIGFAGSFAYDNVVFSEYCCGVNVGP